MMNKDASYEHLFRLLSGFELTEEEITRVTFRPHRRKETP